MGQTPFDWDAYRLVLALARGGGVEAAAEALGVARSTVFRRLNELEAALERPLFHRVRGRYAPTEDGARLLEAAGRMEEADAAAMRALDGGDAGLRGRAAITASLTLGTFFLARHAGVIARAHPGLVLDIHASDEIRSLAHREADLALRPRRPEDPALFGRKLADIRWAVYAGTGAQTGRAEGADAVIEGPDFGAPGLVRGAGGGLRSNALLLSASLAAQTGRAAHLPVLLGAQWPGLVRRPELDPDPPRRSELWIVCHGDMRRNARVRALFDALIDAAARDRALLEGG